ncbi:MAG TPA: response regulator [Gaiellaceae bacterium]|jgi:DNA-binding response OmpR family regulator
MNDNVNTTQEDVVRTILIADDDEDILALVHRALSESGYEVLLARDGAAALTTARERKPALALLDIAMPELDGYEVTSALKNDPATKDTIVILFTARSEASDVEKGYDVGADDYIMKPFTLKTLQSRVLAALEQTAGAADN